MIEQKRKITTGVTEVKEIASYVHNGYAGGRPLESRYRLGLQISEAVLSVHSSNRVHKNIRPDTILMLKAHDQNDPDSHDLDFGTPYLTDWTMPRKMDTPSSMTGENDWQRDLYRHPRRHGLQPEKWYNMGHDSYSLGVCLLEIELWEPRIDRDHNPVLPCVTYRGAAMRLRELTTEDVRRIRALTDPQPAQDNPVAAVIKVLTRPSIIHSALVALAESYLPARMGMVFTRLVILCLKCLESEGGFGGLELFEKKDNKIAIGVKFGEMVLQSLSSLAS
ncbi:hypothetical protein MMC11_006005 [Xylographa trunciseda]|nr:hypothetical protein [Xylographa trunciseda]